MTYIPKGSMCTACANIHKDCSGLPFARMPKVKEFDHFTVVICTEFRKPLPPVSPTE